MSEQITINLIEVLKKRFPTEVVNPYGECLVVPSKQFERGWEQVLTSQGFKIFANGRGGESAFFIRLTKPENNHEKPEYAYEPQELPAVASAASPRATAADKKPKLRRWTPQEEAKLKEMVMRNMSNREIAKALGKSKYSIIGKVSRMGLSNIRPPALPNRNKTGGTSVPPEKPKQTSKEIVLPVIDNGGDVVKEFLLVANGIYPQYKRACGVLLSEASKILNGGK